jgi:uncharacterized RDD family membrane protein YckC
VTGPRCRSPLLIAFVLSLSPAAAAAAGAEFGLTGNEKALWLVRKTDKGFDIVVKPTGEGWKWCVEGQAGPTPSALCAVGERLHVLFSSGDHFHVPLDGRVHTERKADHPSWPKDLKGVIVVESVDFAGKEGSSLLAIAAVEAQPAAEAQTQPATKPASRPASGPASTRPTQPATAPSTAPAGERLTLRAFHYDWTTWSYWPELDITVSRKPDGAMLAAFANSRLHVYVPGQQALLSLRWNKAGEWSWDIRLEGRLAELLSDGRALALLAIQGQLTMVLAGPAQSGTERALHVATFDGSKWRLQQVTHEGKPATWPADKLPLVCRLAADQIALIDPAEKIFKFSSCALAGNLTRRADVDIFEKRPPDAGRALQLLEYFMWGLLIAAVVPLFLFRPKGRRGPFAIPSRRVPGKILKRLLAAILDMLPAAAVAAALFRPPVPAEPLKSFREIQPYMDKYMATTEAAWAVIAYSAMYVAYCAVMEMRFGATVGKMVLKLRVVNDQGRHPNLREAFLRNVFKLVEMAWPPRLPLLLLLPLFNRNRQRLGDIVARTAVIDAGYLAPPPPAEEQLTAPPDDIGSDQDDEDRQEMRWQGRLTVGAQRQAGHVNSAKESGQIPQSVI